MELLKKIFTAIFSKKKIMAWIAAVVLAVAALVFGIDQKEIREAINEAPVIEIPVSKPSPEPVKVDGK